MTTIRVEDCHIVLCDGVAVHKSKKNSVIDITHHGVVVVHITSKDYKSPIDASIVNCDII